MNEDSSQIQTRVRNALLSHDYGMAETLLTNALKKNGDDAELLASLGSTYVRDNQYERALSIYKKLYSLDPENIDAAVNMGAIYRYMKKYDESIAILNEALKKRSYDSEIYYNLGNTYKEMGAYQAAEDCFSAVIEQNPRDVLAYNHLGKIRALNGNNEKAITAYKKGLTVDPNHPVLHFNMGCSMEALKRYDEAALEYKIALKKKPGWIDAMKALAGVYEVTQKDDLAFEQWNMILVYSPDDVQALTGKGKFYASKNQLDEALECYQKAVKLDPSFLPAALSIVSLYEKKGEYDAALEKLTPLAEQYPNDGNILIKLASLYMRKKRYIDAKETVLRALRLNTKDLDALELLAKLYICIGNMKYAQKSLKKILSYDSSRVRILYETARLLFELRKYSLAEAYADKYASICPKDLDAKLLLGEIREAKNDDARALKIYDEILSIDGGNAAALSAVGRLHQRRGETAEAIRAADQLVNLQGSRAEPEDLSSLNDSIALYEGAAARHTDDGSENVNRNIEKLKDLLSDEDVFLSESDSTDEEASAREIAEDLESMESEISDADSLFTEANDPFDSDEDFDSLFSPNDDDLPPAIAADADILPDLSDLSDFDDLPDDDFIFDDSDGEIEEENADPAEPEAESDDEINPDDREESAVAAPLPTAAYEPPRYAPVYFVPAQTAAPPVKPYSEPEPPIDPEPAVEPPLLRTQPAASQSYSAPAVSPDTPARYAVKDADDSSPLLRLMLFLRGLIMELPEDRRDQFRSSEEYLQLEYIIERLSGKKGLYREILSAGKYKPTEKEPGDWNKDIPDTLEYMKKMSGMIEDGNVAAALGAKIDGVIKRVKNNAGD